MRTSVLSQGSANLFCKEQDSKYCRFCELNGFYNNLSTLPLLHENSHRQQVNEWSEMCSNKMLFKEICGELYLTW
jgi:hypothetical protein